MGLSVIILAAGKGSRMRSDLPKVLHQLAGKPLVSHVIDKAKKLSPEQIVIVYGHGGDTVKEVLNDDALIWAEQKEQLGTGHAIAQAMPHVNLSNQVLTLYGDVPLIEEETLKQLIDCGSGKCLGLLTVTLDNPTGYGRIIRENGDVQAIVEQKDASESQLSIKEVNTGILCLEGELLQDYLKKIDNNNAQGEYYLTDVIGLHTNSGQSVITVNPSSELEVEGINDRVQLASVERRFQAQQATHWMHQGVTLVDPQRIEFRGDIHIGQDSFVDINVIFEGHCTIGKKCHIESGVILRNVRLGDNCHIKAHSILEECECESSVKVGPFARIRPQTYLSSKTQIGNFVEIKKTRMGEGSKASHLTYLGDAEIGRDVNIGAGTITCNYDGANKHKTTIKDNVFVGSDTQLVAPVTLGEGVTVGAGTTVTQNVNDGELVISRTRQKTIPGYKRPVKNQKM
ncbi:MAG: bifunctional UDP-N-acetylglucosamine diphosphorylase/glucosamine-1-phosphate N-acetyltransferase GlmU [Pseudomonadota bacterium]